MGEIAAESGVKDGGRSQGKGQDFFFFLRPAGPPSFKRILEGAIAGLGNRLDRS